MKTRMHDPTRHRSLAALAVVILLGSVHAIFADVVAVRGSAQLQSALTTATGGEVIVLADGRYGAVTISQKYTDYVTITSANPLGAIFEAITINNSSYLRLEALHVEAESNGGAAAILLAINDSDHISVLNCEINGKVDDVQPIAGYFGLRAKQSSVIRVQNSFVHDVLNGMVFFASSQIEVLGNHVDRIGADAFKFGGVDTALIENNFGPSYLFPAEKTHSDFMQFQGKPSRNLTIRGNVFLPQNRFDTQGIFVAGDGGHTNVLIEGNIIYTGMANGIYVADGSTGITITNNTLLNADSALDRAVTRIAAPSGARVQNNITTGKAGGLEGGNLTLQRNDPGAEYYAADFFPDFDFGGANTLAETRPKPGSAAVGIGRQ